MSQQDTTQIKEKIVSLIRNGGPKLPVHIAKEIEMSMIFASAFLSELISEKSIKMTHMRVGSSPVYYISGQEPKLEQWSTHLKSKEQEAFELLKSKKTLKDRDQDPAIRVALRAIKDFAIPEEKNSELYWRYFTHKEEIISKENLEKKEFESLKEENQTKNNPEEKEIKLGENKNERNSEQNKEVLTEKQITKEEKTKEKELGIFENEKKAPKKEKTKKAPKKKKIEKTNEKFFNKVKEFLLKKNIEIIGIEGFSKKDLFLRIRENSRELLLVAYNKKRINETDLINAYKKSRENELEYVLLSTGEPSKKINELIDASKKLVRMENVEE
jgi:hypothetical protein